MSAVNSELLCVGSGNPVKIEAVKEVAEEYDFLKGLDIVSIGVDSGVEEQPKSMDDIVTGAKNRAERAFESGCRYSLGIEDGVMKIPQTKSGYMNFTCCAIFDGEKFHLGFSSGFEYPEKVMKMVINEGLNISQAFYQAGIADTPEIGREKGAIGILTRGRLPRKELVKQSVSMALIHLENQELYG